MGIYVTTNRVIGAKGSWRTNWDSELDEALFKPLVLGGAAGTADEQHLSKDDATRAVELLEDEKEFEVIREDLEEIRIEQKKGALGGLIGGGSKLAIKTPKDTHIIDIGKQKTKEGVRGEVQRLKDMFNAFAKDKFIVEEK